MVCWGTGLQIVQLLWTNYPAKMVMKEFKIAWVKHDGWLEIIVHDQCPEFMGNEFQNPAGAAGVLTMPIDSQSSWQNGKTERAGQSFKHQLWDLDEECHIEGETEFEAAVDECCDGRNRYCNRSGFSARQRVFGSSLRLFGSLLSDDPIDCQLLTADPCTNFHLANEMRTAAQRALFKQNSARAVQAEGLAFHRSQPRKYQCGRYGHGVAQQQFDWKKRMDWTRCRGCSITNENIFLDVHAWMPSEVFK